MSIIKPNTPSQGQFGQIECFVPARMPSGKPWPKITIVTPTYKRAKLLEETIKSVISQKYSNIEYIVIDGGTDKNTKEVLDKYKDYISYSESEADRGQSHALNKGFARATGDILTWLNDDDAFAPDALYSIALAFDMHQCDMVAGAVHLKRDRKFDGFHMASCAPGVIKLRELLDLDGGWNAGRFFYQPEVAFTKEIWHQAGGTIREDLHYSMDYDLWVRFAALDARIAIIGSPICNFLIHEEQKTLGSANSGFKGELQKYVTQFKREHGITVRPGSKGNGLARVCIVSDYGMQFGAGIAHRRIGEALQSAGHSVTSLRVLNDQTWMQTPPDPGSIDRIISRVVSLHPDVILLGNLHSTNLSPTLASKLADICPTFILTHDFWWLNGHCPYPMAPEDEAHVCENSCPRWYDYPNTRPGRISQLFEEKIRLFTSNTGLSIAANSKWAAQKYSETLRKINSDTPIYPIRLGVPTDIFYPRNKKELRKKHRIDESSYQIIISCTDIADKRKRVYIITHALELLGRNDISLLIVGRGEVPESMSFAAVRHLGAVDNEELLAEYYSCADLHISASSAETFGQTLLEASACGVPVIAMSGSGTEDIVFDGYNGLLLQDNGAQALADAIARILDDPILRASLSFWGPLLAANEFSYFRSYYSFYRMFEESKVLDAGNFKRKIDFTPSIARGAHDIWFETMQPVTPKPSARKKSWVKRMLHKMPVYMRYRERRREQRQGRRLTRN